GPVLNGMPNSIAITGHTDARQYATGEREYSNWELSADRANAARRELVAGGMDENKVRRVQGLSSTVNIVDDPYADANRRISILVINARAERRTNEQDATYAAPIDLDQVLGVDGSDRLGVEQRTPHAFEENVPMELPGIVPQGGRDSGETGGLLPLNPFSAEQSRNMQHEPLTPGASNLVETLVFPPAVLLNGTGGAGTLGNIK